MWAHPLAFVMTDLFACLAAAAETQRPAAAASGSRRRSASALHCRPLAAQHEPVAMRPSPVASSLVEPAVAWLSLQRLSIVECRSSGSSRLSVCLSADSPGDLTRSRSVWRRSSGRLTALPACCSSSPALVTRACVRARVGSQVQLTSAVRRQKEKGKRKERANERMNQSVESIEPIGSASGSNGWSRGKGKAKRRSTSRESRVRGTQRWTGANAEAVCMSACVICTHSGSGQWSRSAFDAHQQQSRRSVELLRSSFCCLFV